MWNVQIFRGAPWTATEKMRRKEFGSRTAGMEKNRRAEQRDENKQRMRRRAVLEEKRVVGENEEGTVPRVR